MDSARSTRALPRVGFPIRRSRDQGLVSTSPALIAAAHVLHRLLAPRHPPCALVLLIEKNTLCVAMEFSRCTRVGARRRENRPAGRSLKTQQRVLPRRPHRKACGPLWRHRKRCRSRGRHCSRRAGCPDDPKVIDGPAATGVIAPESLERR